MWVWAKFVTAAAQVIRWTNVQGQILVAEHNKYQNIKSDQKMIYYVIEKL